MGRNYYDLYPRYVSVGEKRRNAQMAAEKLMKKGKILNPVIIEGKKVVNTFWGIAWCDNMEAYQDFENRIGRGHAYVKNGYVIDLKIGKGKINALVQGSSLYKIEILIDSLSKSNWTKIKKACTGKISSLIELISGKLSDEIIGAFCDLENGLFPKPSEIKMKCSCPDYSSLCKHLAATLYGIGARLDSNPELFFDLRDIDKNELFTGQISDSETLKKATNLENMSVTDMAQVFDIELDTIEEVKPPVPKEKPTTKTTPKTKLSAKKPKPKPKKLAPQKLTKKKISAKKSTSKKQKPVIKKP